MGIDRRFNGIDLRGDELWLEAGHGAAPRLARSTRIGVDYAGEWALKPWRFFERGSPYVSGGRTRAPRATGAGRAALRNNARART